MGRWGDGEMELKRFGRSPNGQAFKRGDWEIALF